MQIATMASSVVIGALALSTGPEAVQVAAQATSIQLVLPIDVVELVKVTFTGIAAVFSIVAAIYGVWTKHQGNKNAAANAANAADLKLLERNTNSMTHTIEELARKAGIHEGVDKEKRAGAEVTEAKAQGIEQGIAQERDSVAAANPAPATASAPGIVSREAPVPVEDDRAAKIGERGVAAAEALADATKDIAATAKKP